MTDPTPEAVREALHTARMHLGCGDHCSGCPDFGKCSYAPAHDALATLTAALDPKQFVIVPMEEWLATKRMADEGYKAAEFLEISNATHDAAFDYREFGGGE